MIYSWLNLNIHNFFHLSFCVSSLKVQETKQEYKENYENKHYVIASISSFKLHNTQPRIWWISGMQKSSTHRRRLIKASTKSIHNSLSFNLSSICLVVDYNSRERTCSIFRPVFIIFINHSIVCWSILPFSFIWSWKAWFYTFFSLLII